MNLSDLDKFMFLEKVILLFIVLPLGCFKETHWVHLIRYDLLGQFNLRAALLEVIFVHFTKLLRFAMILINLLSILHADRSDSKHQSPHFDYITCHHLVAGETKGVRSEVS